MARVLAAVCGVLWAVQVLAVDRPAVLLAGKAEFLKQTEAARDAYLQAVDAQRSALQSRGEADAARHLGRHRGAWLLGDITAAEYRAYEAAAIPPDHLPAVDAYIAAEGECRTALAAVYQQIIDEAVFIKRDEEAAEYQRERESFQAGEYCPTAFEVTKPKPYDVRRIGLDASLIMAATATKIPDELFVDFRDPNFSISGVKRTESANIDGKTSSDFGKGVVFVGKSQGPLSLRGYFMIGVMEEGAEYAIITANKTKLTLAMSLNDLELDTVYEWSIEQNRDAFRIEVRQDGEVIQSERAVGGNGVVVGFCATLKHAETQSRLVVAVE